ncbi:MAG: hypothetical protein RLZZ148_512 [Cyanobacteriota bacterium]|jgi:hypothetical protein
MKTEIIFLVETDSDGGFTAQALGESIFTQADTLEILKLQVCDAVYCHFSDEKFRPKTIYLSTIYVP